MVWNACDVRRAGIILGMATVAIRRQRAGEVVGVAGTAGYACMRAGQGKRGLAVVKRSRLPRCGVMADLALLRNTCLHMVWSGRLVKVLRVATVAIGRRVCELPIEVAQIAGN